MADTIHFGHAIPSPFWKEKKEEISDREGGNPRESAPKAKQNCNWTFDHERMF